MPLHVAIADDHTAVRLGLKYFILEWMPGTLISFAEDTEELMNIFSRQPVDIVLLDINIPGGNNLRIVKTIKEKQHRARILVFSAFDEMTYGLKYLQAGADGYLQKDKGEEHIKEALNTVFRGGKYLGNRLREYLLQQNFNAAYNPLDQLSDREMEVCQLLVKGMGISEIANSLLLHTSTISTYKTKIYEKLGVRNTADLLNAFKVHSLS
ncbi:response regulator transcription factor [Olivibacter sp. SA151]|uniref:response regulator n=1 Tax=Olivibacter TaxID=376469 RepID=UPI0025A3604F|nr:response regulator transcription factor [Olivibacter sp. 47]MDM8176442.1 response regulator transcription factor [Olivibacter sp. 47]